MKTLKTGAAAIVLTMALSVPAQAQTFNSASDFVGTSLQGHYAGVMCNLGGAFGWTYCAGAIAGNDEGVGGDPNRGDVETFVANQWGGPGTYVGDLGTGTTVSGLMGSFVLAVKGARNYSLYYFDAWGGSDISLATAMNGVSPGNGISHVSLFDAGVSVPEPGTMLLLGTGLLGMAAVRRRREDVV